MNESIQLLRLNGENMTDESEGEKREREREGECLTMTSTLWHTLHANSYFSSWFRLAATGPSQGHLSNVSGGCTRCPFQPSKARSECKELKMLCAEDEQSRTCWTTAFRLLKVDPSTTPPLHNPPFSRPSTYKMVHFNRERPINR
jgi:hypothetical protein